MVLQEMQMLIISHICEVTRNGRRAIFTASVCNGFDRQEIKTAEAIVY